METTKKCSLIAKMLERKTLPQLPDEFDKEYVVDVDGSVIFSFKTFRLCDTSPAVFCNVRFNTQKIYLESPHKAGR